jgi:metallopeptidase MepB
MATATGKFSKPPQAPPLFNHTKDSLAKRFEEIAREEKELNDAIVADIKPDDATWENAWLKGVMLGQEQSNDAYIIDFYQSVSADKELRDEAVRGSEMLEKANIQENMRLDVYQRFTNIYKMRESFNLDPEALRILDKDHKGFIKMGLSLPEGEKRDRFKAIKERMTELTTQFSKTLNEEDGGLWLTPEELDGMSADDLERLENGTGENEGKKRLTFKYPDVIPSMKFVKDSAVRRKIGLADGNKVCHVLPSPSSSSSSACSTTQWPNTNHPNLTSGNSATRTRPFSRSLSCCVTRPLASLDTPTTRP